MGAAISLLELLSVSSVSGLPLGALREGQLCLKVRSGSGGSGGSCGAEAWACQACPAALGMGGGGRAMSMFTK